MEEFSRDEMKLILDALSHLAVGETFASKVYEPDDVLKVFHKVINLLRTTHQEFCPKNIVKQS